MSERTGPSPRAILVSRDRDQKTLWQFRILGFSGRQDWRIWKDMPNVRMVSRLYIYACWTLSLSELPNLFQNRPKMCKFAGSIGVPCLNHTTLLSKIQITDRRGCSFQQAGFVWKYGISLNPMVYHQFTIKMTICWVFPIFRPTHMWHPYRKNHTSWIMIHPKIMDLVAGSTSLLMANSKWFMMKSITFIRSYTVLLEKTTALLHFPTIVNKKKC